MAPKKNYFEQFQIYSVKNRNELVELVKDTNIEADKYRISFYVVGLYPNVPINTSLKLVEDWLLSNSLPNEEVEDYIKLIRICMNQNPFWFKYHSKIFLTAMGHISPYLVTFQVFL